MNLDGLYIATLTPFNSDESINPDDLSRLISHNCQAPVDGLYVGGSTAEAFLCSTEERIEILQVVEEQATNQMRLIAHVGDISTRKSEQIAKAISGLNYDAISAVTPFYYPVGFQQLKRHYADLIQVAGKPMVVYNFPAFSGMNLSAEQISELLNMDGVVALKQTSANLYQLEQIVRNNPQKTVYNGFDEILASGLIAGAHGGIGSTYNIQAQRIYEIHQAILQGDTERATQLQHTANSVIDTLVEAGVIPALKFVLKEKGVLVNDSCRRPLNVLSSESKQALTGLLEAGLC